VPELSWKRKGLPVEAAGFSAVSKRHNFRKIGFVRHRREARSPNFIKKTLEKLPFIEEKMPNKNNSQALAPLPELLMIFWESHSPGRCPWSRQYQAAIFYHNEVQKQLALETRVQVVAKIKGKIFTQILPAGEFYLDEDYHQKYFLLRDQVLLNELTSIYPSTRDLLLSTAAARLNGYVAGYGNRAGLEAELNSLGLSPAGISGCWAWSPSLCLPGRLMAAHFRDRCSSSRGGRKIVVREAGFNESPED
jgi:hypothetical protein